MSEIDETCAACGATVTPGIPYNYTLWIRQADGKAIPSDTKGVRQLVRCSDCRTSYVIEDGLPYWWDDQQGRFVLREDLKGNELMPSATKDQMEQIKSLRQLGVLPCAIYKRAGLGSKDWHNWIGRGCGPERAQRLGDALASLLAETPPPEPVEITPLNPADETPIATADEAAKLDHEGLDWTTNGLKVWTAQVDSKVVDFWSIGREVEALWLEAEQKLKSLPENEADILRATIKRRITV